ncbi:tetratricopeptide repeat protein [Candidatus Sumerlaeota bacterium]|nr:tetratricopeptide repeat protein [Candidatus Sumerlaeota bacterium]
MSSRARKRLMQKVQPDSSADESSSAPSHSKRRKWLFRLSAMFFPCLLLFILLESGLRLGGYGYSTDFFIRNDARDGYTTNHRYGWRFFPRAIAREPLYCKISGKPAGTIRIFLFGGSAAQGIPEPSFNFGKILEVMLRQRFPGARFEVVNTAMTAINSHVVREIARDCAEFEPDIFIVYVGNNEVIGPYGPGTVFQQWLLNGRLIRLSLWLKATRAGQLLSDVSGRFQSDKAVRWWEGLQMFVDKPVTADDPRLETVYENYRRNLTDVCRIAQDAGAAVILSTVATNLKDFPPLISRHRPQLSDAELERWESYYQRGIELKAEGQWALAIEQYEAAAQLDDRYAELHFRLGQCLDAAGRSAAARDCYIAARDLDALRFRTDTRINAIVREAAAEQPNARVWLADAERALTESEETSDSDRNDLFYEHVHLTFDGNYLLARAVLDQVEAALPEAVRSGKTGAVPSRQQCADALVLTPWDEYLMAYNIMTKMMSRPPFTNQLGHAARQAAALARVEALRRRAASPQAVEAARIAYEHALMKSPDDRDLHYRFAVMATHFGQPAVAARHLAAVVEMQPWSLELRTSLGVALDRCGRSDEAMLQYRKVLDMDPNDVIALSNLGLVLADQGRIDEAIAQLEKAVEIKPDFSFAHGDLGKVLAMNGRLDEGVAHLRTAVKIDPENAVFYNNLGVFLARCGREDEAAAHFRSALQLQPDYAEARRSLEFVLASRDAVDKGLVAGSN